MNRIDRHQLAKISLFAAMDEAQIDKVVRIMRVRHYKSGDLIIREGEIGGELFILIKGSIEISKRLTLRGTQGEDLRNKSLVRLNDRDNVFFGEMSIFGDEQRSATVRALDATTLGVLTTGQVRRLAETEPLIGYRMFYNIGKTVADNLRRANRDILKLSTAFCLALEGKGRL